MASCKARAARYVRELVWTQVHAHSTAHEKKLRASLWLRYVCAVQILCRHPANSSCSSVLHVWAIGIEWGMTVLDCMFPIPFFLHKYGRTIRAKARLAPALDVQQDQRNDGEPC